MAVMRTHYLLAPLLVVLCGYYFAFQVEYSSRAMDAYMEYLSHEVFPWVIGCTGFVKMYLVIFYRFRRKLPRFPGLSTWLASIQIYIGTAFDVLVCFGSLLRINLRYLGLAIVPLMAICFISVLCLRHNQVMGGHGGDFKSDRSRTTDGNDDGKKKKKKKKKKKEMMERETNGEKGTTVISAEKFSMIVLLNNNGLQNSRVVPEEFNVVVVLLAPHIILSVSGMVGDPDHDGNSFDISNLFMFLTCMLQDLTLISCGTTLAASVLLYKASLVGLLLTAHILAVNAFGEKVVLLLLPEVVPLLIWFSLHLDRRTPIINVQKIVGSDHFFMKAVIVSMCGCILQLLPKDESLLLYWTTSTSCVASGLITYTIVLVLRLWPEKAGFATLSFEEVLELLTLWGQLLLQVAVGLLAFGGATQVYRYYKTNGGIVNSGVQLCLYTNASCVI